jgi:hypothetical protein
MTSGDENQKRKNKMKTHQVGAKVKGEYYGEKYSGVVTYGRPHTMNDSYLHFVKLDAPIIVFSAEREAIVITSGKENTIFPI